MKNLFLIIAAIVVLFSCATVLSPDKSPSEASENELRDPEFNAYWYTGKAELSSYDLQQARYGEMHEGKSLMIFVTEDFLLEDQVKKESASSGKATSILKLNKIDRFKTGLYDYSIMLSTFTPIQRNLFPQALKTTFTSQDWCGQSFMQMNLKEGGYLASTRSYFESEGDEDINLGNAILEDELWTRLRMDPLSLPQGKVQFISSSQHIRLRHTELTTEQAEVRLTLQVTDDNREQYVYSVNFDSGRKLTIFFQSVFPYRIYGWEEKVKSGFGQSSKWLTTKATLDKTIKSSYWAENSPEFMPKRKELGLD